MINTQSFFEDIFKNCIENSILLMDTNGVILDVNKGFLQSFGYTRKDLIKKHFELLFTQKDRDNAIPENEIKATVSKKSKSDNNYLQHKDGTPIWVLGESILVKNEKNEKYIVKIIQNINTQKKLEGFLLESDDFINTIFESVKDVAFVMLNSELRILRTNKLFCKIFDLKNVDLNAIKFAQVPNSFFKQSEVKNAIIDVIVTKKSLRNKLFNFVNTNGKQKQIEITSKLMENETMGRTILLIFKVK